MFIKVYDSTFVEGVEVQFVVAVVFVGVVVFF